MKKTILKKHMTAGLLALAALQLSTAASQAALYHVDINTTPLNDMPASANAPFYLDFQFSSGSATEGNNSVSLTNFTFAGGSATGATTTFGLASGDMTSSVSLQDTSAISELFQQFTSGTTSIGFNVNITGNVDPGLAPDRFSIAILDNSTFQIPTSSPDALSLVTEDLDGSNSSRGALNFYVGTGDYAGVFAAVPEPGTAFFGTALLGAIGMARRRNRSAALSV